MTRRKAFKALGCLAWQRWAASTGGRVMGAVLQRSPVSAGANRSRPQQGPRGAEP